MVTWGGFFSERQKRWKRATSQSSQRRRIKVSVLTRSTRSFVRRKLWENMKWNCRICPYCLSVQAMNSSVFGTRVDFWVNYVVWSRMWHTSMPPTLEEASQGALPCKPQKENPKCLKRPVFQRGFQNIHPLPKNLREFFREIIEVMGKISPKKLPELRALP